MRRSGPVTTIAGLRRGDHVCWGFDDPGDFQRAAVSSVVEGLAAGERVYYLGRDRAEQLRDHLAEVPGIGQALETGGVLAAEVDSLYPKRAGLVEPDRQIDALAEATRAALVSGYAGLRVIADITGLVRAERGRDAFARYEMRADQFIAGYPITGICAFDRDQLDEVGSTELASIHPLVHSAVKQFSLHASDDPTVSAILTGELDMCTERAFTSALRRADLPLVDGKVVIDARELSFTDHRSLYALAATCRDHSTTVSVLAPAGSLVSRLVQLLDIAGLEVHPG